MKHLYILILVICSLLLTGCQWNQQPNTVFDTKTKVVAPSDALLVSCKISQPPAIDEFLNPAISDEDRKAISYQHTFKLYSDLADCNKRWKALRDWKSKQIKLYGDSAATGDLNASRTDPQGDTR